MTKPHTEITAGPVGVADTTACIRDVHGEQRIGGCARTIVGNLRGARRGC